MDLLNLRAVLGLDSSKYENGLERARSLGSSFLGATSSAFKTAGKVAGVALGAAATSVTALTKQAYSAYADYQQLSGGVETLFGNSYSSIEEYAKSVGKSVSEVGHEWEEYQGRADRVMENAKNAYKTAGMTANEYMETVTSFAASLNSSLGENAYYSANYADVAITDMADNANKMGTSMESIQNAYMGFSKQNFAMLDNLKLGYGGTKSEMERLLRDAEKLAGYKVGSLDASNFADVVDAIHIVQEEMGITGTTAAEADKTISGSFASLKSAWSNLVAGFADPDADLSELINNVVTTAGTAVKNALPTIVQALKGIGQAIEELVPIIGQELPGLIQEILPSLLSAATSLVKSLADALPTILQVLSDQLPSVLETIIPVAVNGLTTIVQALSDALPTVLQALLDNMDIIIEGVISIAEAVGDALIKSLPILLKSAEKMVMKLLTYLQTNMGKFTSNIGAILKSIGEFLVKTFPVMFPMLVEVAVELLKSLTKYITENADEVISGILEIVFVIIDTLTNPDTLMQILECAIKIVVALAEGILNNLDKVLESMGALIVNITTFLVEAIPELVTEIGKNGAKIITDVIPNLLINIGEAGGELLGKVIETIGGWWQDIFNGASSVFSNIGGGLLDAWDYIKGKITDFGGLIWGGIKDAFKGMWEFGKELGTNIWNGIKSMWGKLSDALNPKNWLSGGALDVDIEGGLIEQGYSESQAKEAMKILEEQGEDAAKAYLDGQEKGYGINSPSKKMRWIGQMIMEGFNKGMSDVSPDPIMVDPVSVGDVSSTVRGTEYNNPVMERIDRLENAILKLAEREWSVTAPVFIGNKQVDELYVDSKQNVTVRSGGQVDV